MINALRTHPNSRNLLALTLLGLSFTVAFQYIFSLLYRPLAPYTIIQFEYAGSAESLNAMTAVWGAAGVQAAQWSLWIDFLFMPAYAALAGGLVLLTARASAGVWQTAGLWLALAPLVAWACDIFENIVLLTNLPPAAPSTLWLTISTAATNIKFGLLGVCLVYFVAALIWLGVQRLPLNRH